MFSALYNGIADTCKGLVDAAKRFVDDKLGSFITNILGKYLDIDGAVELNLKDGKGRLKRGELKINAVGALFKSLCKSLDVSSGSFEDLDVSFTEDDKIPSIKLGKVELELTFVDQSRAEGGVGRGPPVGDEESDDYVKLGCEAKLIGSSDGSSSSSSSDSDWGDGTTDKNDVPRDFLNQFKINMHIGIITVIIHAFGLDFSLSIKNINIVAKEDLFSPVLSLDDISLEMTSPKEYQILSLTNLPSVHVTLGDNIRVAIVSKKALCINVTIDQHFVDALSKVLDKPKQIVPERDVNSTKHRRINEEFSIEVNLPAIDISLTALSNLDAKGLWSPYHYYDSNKQYSMTIFIKELHSMIEGFMNIKCSFKEATVKSSHSDEKVLVHATPDGSVLPFLQIFIQPHGESVFGILEALPFKTDENRFLSRWNRDRMNKVFEKPFLAYSNVNHMERKEFHDFHWHEEFGKCQFQMTVVIPKLEVDVSHIDLCFFNGIGGLISSSGATFSMVVNSDVRVVLRDEREPMKFVEICFSDLASVLVYGLSRGENSPQEKSSHGMMVGLVTDTFSCTGIGFLSYPVVFLRTLNEEDERIRSATFPPISVLTGDMEIYYKNKQFLVHSLMWTPSRPVLSFMKRASTMILDKDSSTIKKVNKPLWPTVPLLRFRLNIAIAYVRTMADNQEHFLILPLHNILVDSVRPVEGPKTYKVGVERIQGFHRQGQGGLNVRKQSTLLDCEELSRFLKNEQAFSRFFNCAIRKDATFEPRDFLSPFLCNCSTGGLTDLAIDFKNADVELCLEPRVVIGVNALVSNMSDITDVISGPKKPARINLRELLIDNYLDTVDADHVDSNPVIFVDETNEENRAKIEEDLQSALSRNVKDSDEVVVEEKKDDEWLDESESEDKERTLTKSLVIENLDMSVRFFFAQHAENIYKPEEEIKLELSLEKADFKTFAPTIEDAGAPSPFDLNLCLRDISISYDIHGTSWKNFFQRDELSSEVQTPELAKEDEMNKIEFIGRKDAILRLHVHSRNFGLQSLALSLKARIRPINFYITQRALAFAFDFKRKAFPFLKATKEKDKEMKGENKPTVKYWKEFMFDEVHIFPFKTEVNYHPQPGAPAVMWEDGSGHRFLFDVIPSVHHYVNPFADFHFVAPENRPIPTSLLTNKLLAVYSPTWRNVLNLIGSFGRIHLLVKLFKDTVSIIYGGDEDLSNPDETTAARLARTLNTVAVDTIDIGGQVFVDIVRLLHSVDKLITGEELQTVMGGVNTPQNISEGLMGAGLALKRGVTTAFAGITIAPAEAYRKEGFWSSVVTFLVNVPGVALRPVVSVADALSWIFTSVRNTMDPSRRQQERVQFIPHNALGGPEQTTVPSEKEEAKDPSDSPKEEDEEQEQEQERKEEQEKQEEK